MKILAGVYRADAGTVELDGAGGLLRPPAAGAGGRRLDGLPGVQPAARAHASPRTSSSAASRSRRGLVDRERMVRETDRPARRPRRHRVHRPRPGSGSLSVAQQQVVEIVKAISQDARIISMDEPTAALVGHRGRAALPDGPPAERARRRRPLRLAPPQGDLRPVRPHHRAQGRRARAHRATPPRSPPTASSGRWSAARSPASSRTSRAGHRRSATCGCAIRGGGNLQLDGIDLEVRAGEIVGLAGLQGSGRTEIAHALFGVAPFTRGAVEVDGRRCGCARRGRRVRAGLALVTEDRKAAGPRRCGSRCSTTPASSSTPSCPGRRTRSARRIPGVLSSLELELARARPGGALPVRRQPAEGRPGQVARHRPAA